MSENSLLYGDSPLACAWLAASLEKKLSKQQYLKTSIIDSAKAIEQSSEYINSETSPKLVSNGESDSQFKFASQTQRSNDELDVVKNEPKVEPMTLRISGQLLYGVVKIYSRKTRYLFEEISLALIQLKSAFSISKSITLPIEKTVISSLDSITLKDTVTEANVLYDTETFDINKVFGLGSVSSSARNTQLWGRSNSVLESNDDDDYAMGDISVGRHANNESELTGHGTTHGEDYDLPDLDGGLGNDAFDNAGTFYEANESIDALARRSQVPADDLEGADEFELPLDLNLKENETTTANDAGEVPGISDFQLSAIDNMDLEFTVDETHADQSVINHTIDNDNILEFENTFEESDQSDNNEDEYASTTRKRTRKYNKKMTYKNTDVVRTQRKKLLLDDSNEIPTEQLKKNQREYPGQLRTELKQNINKSDSAMDDIVKGLQPAFLNNIGSTWKSIKRRKLLALNNNDIEADVLPVNELVSEQEEGDFFDAVPEFPVEDQIPEEEESHFEPPAMDDYPEFDNGRLDVEPNFEPIDHHEEQPEEDVEEPQENSEERTDFDENYDDIQTRIKATVEVAQELRNVFEKEDQPIAVFDDIVDTCKLSENKKSSATRAFFELLVLGTANTVKLQQDRLFGEITIESKAGLFENFL